MNISSIEKRMELTQKMHLSCAVATLSEYESFTASSIQKVCRIGYNNASRIAIRGEQEGLFRKVDYSGYRLTLTDTGKKLSAKINEFSASAEIDKHVIYSMSARGFFITEGQATINDRVAIQLNDRYEIMVLATDEAVAAFNTERSFKG